MNERWKIRPVHWIATHPWIAAGAMFYAVCLGYVLSTIGFRSEYAVRQYIVKVSGQASHEPIPELPTLQTPQWPDVAMRRDPFQPAVRESTPAALKRKSDSPFRPTNAARSTHDGIST